MLAALGGCAIAPTRTTSSWADEMTATCERMGCPGALLAWSRGGAAPEVLAIGSAAWGQRVPIPHDAVMRIASISKPFVGTLILQLADEGRVDLDAPISRFVAGVPGGEAITLRMLGRNRSGLADPIRSAEFRELVRRDPARVWTLDEVLAQGLALPPAHAPDTTFAYANINTTLLAAVVRRVEPDGLDAALQRRIFAPLGLRATRRASGPLPPSPVHAYRHGAADSWLGYGETLYDVTATNASWTAAAGDIATTAHELTIAIGALARGDLLAAAGREELARFEARDDLDEAYGFTLARRDGAIGHAGDVPGWSSEAWVLADRETCVVVLANSSNNRDGTTPARVLVDRLRARMDAGA